MEGDNDEYDAAAQANQPPILLTVVHEYKKKMTKSEQLAIEQREAERMNDLHNLRFDNERLKDKNKTLREERDVLRSKLNFWKPLAIVLLVVLAVLAIVLLVVLAVSSGWWSIGATSGRIYGDLSPTRAPNVPPTSTAPNVPPTSTPNVPDEYLPSPKFCHDVDAECLKWQHREYGSELLFLIRAEKPLVAIRRILFWFPELKDFKDVDGRTPSHMAYCYGNGDAAELLQDKGADMQVKDYFKNFPVDDYTKDHCKKGRKDMSKIDKVALANDPAVSLFLFMCQDGELENINKHLIGHPDHIVARDFDGRNCLHILAKKGHISLVKHFFGEAGSSSVIFQKDRYGRTSVDEAELNNFGRLADFLRRQAAASSKQDL